MREFIHRFFYRLSSNNTVKETSDFERHSISEVKKAKASVKKNYGDFKMGFFSNIKNALNGTTRERYDLVVSSINIPLSHSNYRERVLYGDKLSSESKVAFFIFLTGYFTVAVHNSFMRTNKFDANIDEIHDYAFRLIKIYLKDELSWPASYVDRTVQEMKEFAYHNPAGVEKIMAIGSNAAANLSSDSKTLALMNGDLSSDEGNEIMDEFFKVDKGYEILDEFLKML
jgi:hypothetical protein